MENNTQIQFIDTFGVTGPEGVIDVDTGSQFAINFAIVDVREPFSKKGVKSYKFNIFGTKENNKLLNHYYDINIVDGTYNNNKKQKIAVLRNGVIILNDAYLQLLQIKKDNKTGVYSDQEITYEVEVCDDVTSFFTEITNKYLEDLDFSDMAHPYKASEVVASFGNSAVRDNVLGTGGYKYVLAWTPLTKYILEECRPAISVYEYWNRIHQAAGYQWEWIGFDTDKIRMDKLWIPYNGDEPKLTNQIDYKVAAKTSGLFVIGGNAVVGNPPIATPSQFTPDIELIDNLSLYNPTYGEYAVNLNTGGDGSINYSFKVTYDVIITNPTSSDIYLSYGHSSSIPSYSIFWDLTTYIEIFNQTFGTVVNTMNLKTTTISTNGAGDIYTLPTGSTIVATETAIITIPATSVNIANVLITKMGLSSKGYTVYSRDTVIFTSNPYSGTYVNVGVDIEVSSIEMIILPDIKTYGFNIVLNMNDFVPAKIKQSDFIKAIANMYNLVITSTPVNDKKIIYSLRDDYYDAGTQKDWTSKLVTDKEENISFISSTNAKKVILSYKQDSDIMNKDYLDQTKEIYGQLEYTLGNENIKGLETKEIIFSPTPCDNTSFGTVNPMWVGKIPKCNIRILIDGGVQPTTAPYDIVDYTFLGVNYGQMGLTTYPMITHQDNPYTPNFDINFGLCDKYYHDFTTITNNNLYTMFWRRTIGQIDSGKLLTSYLILSEYDISILKLNDKIFIKDTWYNINTLQYDPNSLGATKVVLMTIDDRLTLGFPKIIGQPTLATSGAVSVLGGEVIQSTNWNYSDGAVLIRGEGNVVNPDVRNTIILGNNHEQVESNTLYAKEAIINGVRFSSLLRFTDTLQTTTATVTTLTSFEIEDDKMITIEGRVNGFKDDFTSSMGVFYFAVFRKTGGVITQVDATNYILKDDFASSPIVDVYTNNITILVDVKGLQATTINWTNSYEYTIS